jgi:hypothetical protein
MRQRPVRLIRPRPQKAGQRWTRFTSYQCRYLAPGWFGWHAPLASPALRVGRGGS